MDSDRSGTGAFHSVALDSGTPETRLPVRIGHISDIHFGRITDANIVDTLVSDLEAGDLDLVIISGDLTQRAFPGQFRAASQFLDRISSRWLVVPGNHDVYPWWRIRLRLTDPLRRYKKWISEELNQQIDWPDLSVLGINSAHGITIQGGRIDASERASMETFFSSVPDRTFKILVVHHHLTSLDALDDHDVAVSATETLQSAADLDVDMILCGHLHISHIAHVENVRPGHSIVVCTAGTATSDRGRGSNKSRNFYNKIVVSNLDVEIEEREYDAAARRFVATSAHTFARQRRSGP